MLLRLSVSFALLRCLKNRATTAPPHLLARLANWLSLCGSARRNISLAISAEIATPMAAGFLRPSILIPARLLEALNDDELEQIGLHEAAHLARYDDYALIVERVLEALFPWHPVVRWIARNIDLEREIACDDIVVESTGAARSYATCLTRVAELAGTSRGSQIAVAATDERSHLAARIDLLLDKGRRKAAHFLKMRLAATATLLVAVAIFAMRMPVLVAFPPPPSPQQSASSEQVPLFEIPTTITDPSGRYVTGLSANQFKIFEDDVEKPITSLLFDAPLSVGIVLDVRARMKRKIVLADLAVSEFLKTSNPRDEFSVVQLGDQPRLTTRFTTNSSDIQKSLAKSELRGEAPLQDAIRLMVDEMKNATNSFKAILVVSDESEFGSQHSLTWLDQAVPWDLGLFAIVIADRADNAKGEPKLRMLARVAGPQLIRFDPTISSDALYVVSEFGTQLRNTYVLGYTPTNSGRSPKLFKLEVVQIPGLPRIHTNLSPFPLRARAMGRNQ